LLLKIFLEVIYGLGLKKRFSPFLGKFKNLLNCYSINYKKHKVWVNKNFTFYTVLIYSSEHINVKIVLMIFYIAQNLI